MENTKRDLSLDFTKPRLIRGGGSQPAPSLVTPILNLSTPELNKMISGEELAVLTPNAISSIIPQSNVLPSPLIPTTVNNSNNIIANTPTSNGNISLGNSNTNINNNNINNTNSNHISNNNSMQKRSDNNKLTKDLDIDKIEKKRERNRLAAKKCRQRKLETIDELRKTVSDWEQKYSRLENEFEHFKAVRNKEIEELTMEISELKNLIRQ